MGDSNEKGEFMANLSVNANFGLTQGPLPAGMPRRRRLKSAILRGGALAVGFWGHAAGGQVYAAPDVVAAEFHADAFIAIGADGRVALAPDQVDMEPGAYMALAMLVAEALAVDMAAIAPRPASPDVYLAGGAYPRQCVRAPDCMAALREPLRRAAAAARTMLIQAAAARWDVTPRSCRAEQGAVLHQASGRRLRYGELVADATLLPAPRQPIPNACADADGMPVQAPLELADALA